MHILIIEGPPMSGKDSQAKMLVERRGYFHLDCGKILRGLPQFKQMTDAGILLPDISVIDVMIDNLPIQLPKRLVVTGFPRSTQQAKWFRNYFRNEQARVSALMLTISDKSLLDRLADRQKKEARPDDKTAILQKRLKDYHEYGPVVKRFLTHEYRNCRQINAETNLNQVFREVSRYVDSELTELQQQEVIHHEVVIPRVLTGA